MPFGIQKPLWMVFGFMHGVGAKQMCGVWIPQTIYMLMH